MTHKKRDHSWFLLGMSITFAFLGLVQLLHLIVAAIFSDDFSISTIGLLQISLLTCGVWGISEYQRIVNNADD